MLDENIDARIAAGLIDAGHDVVTVHQRPGLGSGDLDALALALAERRVLVTEDTDFGELVLRRALPHAGVILHRLQSTAYGTRRRVLERALVDHASRLSEFLVVTEDRVRIRRSRP